MPAFYYWKDAIVVGSYVHPAGKFSLDITRDKLDGYAQNFKRMAANGVGVAYQNWWAMKAIPIIHVHGSFGDLNVMPYGGPNTKQDQGSAR
jgi:hypothetical protein